MNKNTLRQLSVIVALLAMIVVNGMANAIPLNDQTTAEISDRFQVFFVPAGYVFSIWGLIYLGMLAYAVYQALPSRATEPDLVSIGYPFVLSSVANIAWIFLWHYEFFALTAVMMLALLGLLVAIYIRLDIGRARVSSVAKWLVHVPFAIYLGWITVATIANITSLLYFWDWNGWGIDPEIWTWIMLVAAVLIGGVISATRGDAAFVSVLIWAFVGIAVKQSETNSVATAAWLAAAIAAVSMVAGVFRQRQRRLLTDVAT